MIKIICVGKIKEKFFAQSIKEYEKRLSKYTKLEINGKEMDSVMLSEFIDKNLSNNVVFVIGSSNGISSDVKQRSNFSLSFSKLTFPHQLFRILLLEQIYRSFKIINNESYHK